MTKKCLNCGKEVEDSDDSINLVDQEGYLYCAWCEYEKEETHECLGCGTKLPYGNVCYKCASNGIAMAQIRYIYNGKLTLPSGEEKQ